MSTVIPPERIYPESLEPSETNNQILKTVAGEVVWADETGGSGGGGGTTLDLDLSGAQLYYLDGTPDTYGEYDGTGIVSRTGTGWPDFGFTEIPELDPTHTYELTAAFDTGFGGTYTLWIWAGPSVDDAGYDATDFSHAVYSNGSDLSSGTVTFQIGPGINGWDTSVVSSGNHFLMFESDRTARLISLTITDLDAPTGTVGALDDLSDVVITSPATGDALVFDGSSWVNQSGCCGGGGGCTPTTVDLDLTTVNIPYSGAAQISGTSVTYDGFTFLEITLNEPVLTADSAITFEITGNIPETISLYSCTDPTDPYGVGSNHYLHNAAGSSTTTSQTVEIVIGPGIEFYDDAIAAGELYIGLICPGNPTIDTISYTVECADSGGGSSWVGGTPVFLLEEGQSVADFETATGFTLPIPSIIVRRTSAGGSVGGVPVYLLDLGQSISDYETAHSVTIPSPAIIARKTA